MLGGVPGRRSGHIICEGEGAAGGFGGAYAYHFRIGMSQHAEQVGQSLSVMVHDFSFACAGQHETFLTLPARAGDVQDNFHFMGILPPHQGQQQRIIPSAAGIFGDVLGEDVEDHADGVETQAGVNLGIFFQQRSFQQHLRAFDPVQAGTAREVDIIHRFRPRGGCVGNDGTLGGIKQ